MQHRMKLSYDKITNRVAKHFKNEVDMRTYFAAIYDESVVSLPVNPTTQLRRRRINDFPAVVALSDFVTFQNFRARWEEASRAADGVWILPMKRAEIRDAFNAVQALSKLANTEPGPGILFTLARFIPRSVSANPGISVSRILKILKGEAAAELLEELGSLLNAQNDN